MTDVQRPFRTRKDSIDLSLICHTGNCVSRATSTNDLRAQFDRYHM